MEPPEVINLSEFLRTLSKKLRLSDKEQRLLKHSATYIDEMESLNEKLEAEIAHLKQELGSNLQSPN